MKQSQHFADFLQSNRPTVYTGLRGTRHGRTTTRSASEQFQMLAAVCQPGG